MKPETKSISDLKEGDSVIIRSRNGNNVGVISKLTKTQLTVGLNKFNRSSGRQIGSTAFYGLWLAVPLDGDIERVRAEARVRLLSNKLGGIDWRKQPLETLEKINATLTTPASDECETIPANSRHEVSVPHEERSSRHAIRIPQRERY